METTLQKTLLDIRQTQDEEKLMEFLRLPEVAVALEIARLPHATPRILEILTRHKSIVVRHAVAMNPQIAEQTLRRLCDSEDQLVRDYARLNLEKRLKKN